MVYKNNFIVVVKCNGKVMREQDGAVTLPFGSEYSIMLKNKDSRKAVASVEIDGEDVMNGHKYIVPANTSVELKGFLKGLNAKNKFRFIKKTKEISDFRGDKLDDGLVRVEFWYEEQCSSPWVWPSYTIYNNNYDKDNSFYVDYKGSTGGPGQATYTSNFCSSNIDSELIGDLNKIIKSEIPEEEGITVKGSKTNQQFNYGSVGILENNSSVIIIELKGTTKRAGRVMQVKKPITVKSRIQCSTCGKKWKSSMSFCGNCSTALD